LAIISEQKMPNRMWDAGSSHSLALEMSRVPMNNNVASKRDRVPSRVRLLNVEIDNISMDELVNTFQKGLLLTLHVDMIMKLQKDREFYQMLSQFDVITCDSQILFFAARWLGTPLKERVSGSDFFPHFYAKYKNDPNITVFMCGGAPGVAELARKKVNEKVGREMIVATDSPPLDYDCRPGEIERMIARINKSKASVLVIGLGAGRQEKFIVKYRDRLPHVKIYLPLGGTIDYEAESLKRPPAWITNAGLEWLYRVVREPRQRWHRYFVHQPPFLYLLLKQKLGLYKNPFADHDLAA
jgi:N-acetylglucosaminyldiphosphoundecaprenol N-acetyl-beta-D-mannosaminyltransferase